MRKPPNQVSPPNRKPSGYLSIRLQTQSHFTSDPDQKTVKENRIDFLFWLFVEIESLVDPWKELEKGDKPDWFGGSEGWFDRWNSRKTPIKPDVSFPTIVSRSIFKGSLSLPWQWHHHMIYSCSVGPVPLTWRVPTVLLRHIFRCPFETWQKHTINSPDKRGWTEP